MFRAWDRDPGHWEAVLPKKRSTEMFCRIVGISSPKWWWGGGGGALLSSGQVKLHQSGLLIHPEGVQQRTLDLCWFAIGSDVCAVCAV